MKPTRGSDPPCCPEAACGQAAAHPSSAMTLRRVNRQVGMARAPASELQHCMPQPIWRCRRALQPASAAARALDPTLVRRVRSSRLLALGPLSACEEGEPLEQVHVLLVLEQRPVQRRDELPRIALAQGLG